MRLVRFGAPGAEQPGLIDADGAIRSLAAIVPDLGPDELAPDSLAALAAIDPDGLPRVDGPVRFGPPVAGTRKFLAIENIDGLVLADGDGDGDVDVLTRNLARPGVIVLHNNGKGELSLPLELEFTEPLPTGRGLAVAPVSGGIAGISVPQPFDRLATWLREGTGWIGRAEEYASGVPSWIGGTAKYLFNGPDLADGAIGHDDDLVPQSDGFGAIVGDNQRRKLNCG